MKDTTSLKFLKIVDKNLLKLGFKKQGDVWTLSKKILDDEFLLNVKIKGEEIESNVVEICSNERFVLYDIEGHNGSFVSKMRTEYEKVVDKIINQCCEKEIFKSVQAKKIIKYVNEKYQDELEFLWEKFPDNAIFRNKINKKWYCLIAGVTKNKIYGDGEERIEIINLNLVPERVNEVVDNKKIFKAYHMNKKSWITIPLNGKMETDKIFDLIDESYEVSIKKK